MKKSFQIDQLSVRIYEDKKSLGEASASLGEKLIRQAIVQKGEAAIILATGASQFEFLESFVQKDIEWNRLIAFHLDEYIGISENHPASFRKYLRERIFDRVNFHNYFLIQGDRDDPQEECKRIGSIFNLSVVDVAFIGIGENGHIAFNDPPASFHDEMSYKIVELDQMSRNQQFKEGWFKTFDEVPGLAITMTIPAILRSKYIVCTVPDLRKAEAVKNTLKGEISPNVPASILRSHPNATLLLDEPAASLLSQ